MLPGDEPSYTESALAQRETAKSRAYFLSTGVIAGIATAVVLYVVRFIFFIFFIYYHKLKVLDKIKLLISGKKHESAIDGRYQKAELDCQGHEVNITRLYELDATSELQR